MKIRKCIKGSWTWNQVLLLLWLTVDTRPRKLFDNAWGRMHHKWQIPSTQSHLSSTRPQWRVEWASHSPHNHSARTASERAKQSALVCSVTFTLLSFSPVTEKPLVFLESSTVSNSRFEIPIFPPQLHLAAKSHGILSPIFLLQFHALCFRLHSPIPIWFTRWVYVANGFFFFCFSGLNSVDFNLHGCRCYAHQLKWSLGECDCWIGFYLKFNY